MTKTTNVSLEAGMTAIRRDGKRVGPMVDNGGAVFKFTFNGFGYMADGSWLKGEDYPEDIIAAGYPWVKLGAQIGDTVQCVWNGRCAQPSDFEVVLAQRDVDSDSVHPDSLFVIVKRAAKLETDDGYLTYDHSATPDVYLCSGCSQRAYQKWKKGDPQPVDPQEIEWGEWVEGPKIGPVKDCILEYDSFGREIRHRLPEPKPPMVEMVRRRHMWGDGLVTMYELTRTNGVVTVEVVK
jgi:hypothetical protein